MTLDRGAAQRHGIDVALDELSMLQPLEHTIQNTAFDQRRQCVDGMSAAKVFGQAAPFAALLGNVQDDIQDLKIREAGITSLTWQTALDQTMFR